MHFTPLLSERARVNECASCKEFVKAEAQNDVTDLLQRGNSIFRRIAYYRVVVEQKIERRSFLIRGAMIVFSSLISGTLASSVAGYLFGKPRIQRDEGWADAGEVSEVRQGTPQQITFERSRTDAWKVQNEKVSAWVVLNNEDSITAFSPLCTHLGCAYRWDTAKHLFLCPCHGSTFDKNGQVVTGPASRPLDRYAVKVEGSRLWLGPVERSRES